MIIKINELLYKVHHSAHPLIKQYYDGLMNGTPAESNVRGAVEVLITDDLEKLFGVTPERILSIEINSDFLVINTHDK